MLIKLMLFMEENNISVKELSEVIDKPLSGTCRMLLGLGKMWFSYVEKIVEAYPKIKEYGYSIFLPNNMDFEWWDYES